MTNLQAIDLLKGLEQSLDDYCELNDEGKTAFGMAITALELFGNSEQLPSAQTEQRSFSCGQENDTISRQAAINATWFEPSYTDPLNVLTEVRDRLKALPPAQPDTYEALRILDAINSSGRLDYGDYCDLYDAISEIGGAQNG